MLRWRTERSSASVIILLVRGPAEVARRRKRLLSKANRDEERQQSRPAQVIRGAGRPRYEDEESAMAEEGILRALLLDPSLVRNRTLPEPEDFSAPELRHIYEQILQRLKQGSEISPATLGAALSGEEMSLLIQLQNDPLTVANSERSLNDCIHKLYECKELRQKPGSAEDLLALQKKLRERKGYEDA